MKSKNMAASTYHVTVLTPTSSSTVSSSTVLVLTWTLSPFILLSAVIFACLISAVVSATKADDIMISPDVLKDRDTDENTAELEFTVSFTRNSGSSISNNIQTSLVLPKAIFISSNDNEVKNLAARKDALITYVSQSKIQRSSRRGQLRIPVFNGNPGGFVGRSTTYSGLSKYLSTLNDNLSPQIFNNFVKSDSSAGNAETNKLNNLNISHLENEMSSEHREISRKLSDTEDVGGERFGTLTARLNTTEDLNTLNNGLVDDDSNILFFRPLSLQKSLSKMSAGSKRHPRSVDGVNEEDLSNSRETESEILHYVEKLQSEAEPCPSRTDKIIILKKAKFKPAQFFSAFAEEVNKTVQLANMINDLLLYTKSPPEEFMDIFFAMTQSLVETGPQVTGCAIAFNLLSSGSSSSALSASMASASSSASPTAKRSHFSTYEPQSLFPYSYRTRDGAVVVTDLSLLYKPQTTTWFSVHRNRSTEGLLKPRNRIYANKTDMGNLTHYNAKWNKTVSVSPDDGYWATPYYDCVLRNWVIQYSVPFYQLEGTTPEFKGVVLLEANFEAIQINQCAEDGSLFSGTHRCLRASTTCKNTPSAGLQVGSYECICKEGYKFPVRDAADKFFSGKAVENAYIDYIRNISFNYTTEFNCLPVQNLPPSSTPLSSEPVVTSDVLARGISLGIQSFSMTVSLIIGVVIAGLRKTKVMRTSIWISLEVLIFGAILLYATVVIQYFEPTSTTCLLVPWFREVGFVIVYGVLVLKVYRILAEFQSRKAHRVHVRDQDLLRYLAVILTVLIAYMSAWTAVNIDHLDNNSTVLEQLYTADTGLAYTLCRSMWWDYVIETGEFIFLCCGIYMCYCVRSAPTEYSEGRFITGAICYETVVSTIFYVLRHLWWYKLNPGHLYLMFFMRCQLTVTAVLLIILGPKLWYAHRPPDEDLVRSRAYSQSDVQDSSSPETMKLNVGISSNGDVEVGEISLTEMDPEDIRAELKRLYTQLQIYKTKTMRKDNPHISKRRGGRKQTHRRFSLQAFHNKHRHHHDHDHEMSKTPEESTNSVEAFTIEPSVKEDPNEGRSVPSVSFKYSYK